MSLDENLTKLFHWIGWDGLSVPLMWVIAGVLLVAGLLILSVLRKIFK